MGKKLDLSSSKMINLFYRFHTTPHTITCEMLKETLFQMLGVSDVRLTKTLFLSVNQLDINSLASGLCKLY